MQATTCAGDAERMKAGLDRRTVGDVGCKHQGAMQKDLLRLCLGDAALLVPAGVAFVPVEPDDGIKRDHDRNCIAWICT